MSQKSVDTDLTLPELEVLALLANTLGAFKPDPKRKDIFDSQFDSIFNEEKPCL